MGAVTKRGSPLQKARSEILRTFQQTSQRVFSYADLSNLLSRNRSDWRVGNISVRRFLAFLLSQEELKQVELTSEKYSKIVRYSWREPSPYEMALSLRSGSYLSHATAVFLHGLNDQIPKTIYVNHEQSQKPISNFPLTQERINLAFASKQRTSNFIYSYEGNRIVLVSGKNSNRLEVATIPGPTGEPLECTKLERTLIDIVVRPAYSGGIFQVFEAYKVAKDRISTNVLVATLKKLAYIYPYHQAIGFLMQRAGYSEATLSRLKNLGLDFDFYLVHGAKRTSFDTSWRIYYPEGL